MKKFLAVAALTIPSIAFAVPITFDLRDPAIESIDEVNSFPLTQGGVTATLTALPQTFNEPPLRTLVLNQTSSSFGINVVNTTCGGLEDSALLDGGCTAESVGIVFNHNVVLNSFKVSSFGGTDQGLITIGATTIDVLTTGTHSLGNVLLGAGNPWSIGWVAGGGFSFDAFTVTAAAEPRMLALIGAILVAGALLRGRRTSAVR